MFNYFLTIGFILSITLNADAMGKIENIVEINLDLYIFYFIKK